MPTYEVTWQIELDADSPEEAAQEAEYIQRDPTSISTYFTVKNLETGEVVGVDTEDIERREDAWTTSTSTKPGPPVPR